MSQLTTNTLTIDELITMANNLPDAGTDLPELTNEGTAADLLSGKELINSKGEKITGTIATKTASNLTASGATVTVPAGYYASQVTKSVTTVTQAIPSVSIDSAGKITATATQTAGYVSAGTKTGTKQLTTQAAKTVTPTTSNQTAVASGRYTTGAITVKGDANLKAANIAKGVSIFGITGKHEGGEDISAETAEYTAQLDELEATIDGLPSGGGGGSMEMCSITLDTSKTNVSGSANLAYVTIENNEIVLKTICLPSSEYISMIFPEIVCVKGTSLVLGRSTYTDIVTNGFSVSGGVEIISYTADSLGCTFKITGDGSITWNAY